MTTFLVVDRNGVIQLGTTDLERAWSIVGYMPTCTVVSEREYIAIFENRN